jgi:DNA-binding transcriptional regulator YdaS (Cro superfamily)
MSTSNLSALEKAVEIAGSQAELARRLGKKQAHIWNWLHRDKQVPAECVLAIESATDGAVTRYDLRPDVFGDDPQPARGKRTAPAR